MANGAIAAASYAQSTAALAVARSANKTACKSLESTFTGKGTMAEKQQYAECVRTLYPSELSGEDVFAVKALIVAGIIGALTGGFIAAREEGFGLWIAGWGFMGSIIAPIIVAALYLAFKAVQFLFS